MQQEVKSVRLVMTLGVAGFFSGLILVSAYLYTLPLIEANKARALEKAIYKVLPGCTAYKTMALVNGQLAETSGAAEAVYAGYGDGGRLVGFAVPAQEIGFADAIVGLIGYDPARKMVVGFEVLESKETPGLGDKIFKDADFVNNFKALETGPGIIAVSKGKKTQPHEVEAITGATISSKAVVRLLNKGLGKWGPAMDDFIAKQPKQ